MNEVNSIQLQLERLALTLSYRVQRIYWSLEEMKNMTDVLFEVTPKSEEVLKQWYTFEQFEKDNLGHIESKRRSTLNQMDPLKSNLPNNQTHSYHFTKPLTAQKDKGFRFYALRNASDFLQNIKQKIEGSTFFYYQDIEYNGALVYPYLKVSEIVPPNFNWQEYHSTISVNPENNPQKTIQWSAPNIDYAGEGLISIVSIPVYQQDVFVGLWSIDVPLRSIYEDCIIDTHIPEQINFITQFDGKLIIHPTIDINIDKDKGAFYQPSISELSPGFKKINLAELIKNKTGTIEVIDENGLESYVIYQVIPDIEWVIFATFPKEVMFQSVQEKITYAFDRMKQNNVPDKIDIKVNSDIQKLVDSYNDMAQVLAYNQKEREIAQQETIEAQRILNQELDEKVKLRTQELTVLNQTLEELANTDPLTGMNNRRHFFELVTPLLKLLERNKKTSSVLLIDIDNFKKINDNYGHHVGDDVIKSINTILTASLRSGDVFARFGGEEFIVFLPNTNLKHGLRIAEKVRQAVEAFTVIKTLNFTVSIGVASLTDTHIEKTIKASDLALYQAKNNGRNRVEEFTSTTK